jgi:hypothetical protein
MVYKLDPAEAPGVVPHNKMAAYFRLLDLPTEILLGIANWLRLSSVITIALTCQSATRRTGSVYFQKLVKPDLDWMDLLVLLEKDLPHRELCPFAKSASSKACLAVLLVRWCGSHVVDEIWYWARARGHHQIQRTFLRQTAHVLLSKSATSTCC